MFSITFWVLGFLLKLIFALFIILLPVAIYWAYRSFPALGPDEVGLMMKWGKITGVEGAETEIKLRAELEVKLEALRNEIRADLATNLAAQLAGKSDEEVKRRLDTEMRKLATKQRFETEMERRFHAELQVIRDMKTELRKGILQSGPVFVPYSFGIKLSGHAWYDLVRIPKEWLRLSVEGKVEHQVWSKDHVYILADVAADVRFPYDDFTSLVVIIQSKVPTSVDGPDGLDQWAEEEIIAGLRNIMASYDHKEIIGHSNLTAILNETQAFFTQRNGLFHLSGICGAEPDKNEPGEGEVIVRLSKINLQDKVQQAMQARVTAEYENEAAQAMVDREAKLASIIPTALDQWIDMRYEKQTKLADGSYPKTRQEISDELTKDGSYARMTTVLKDIVLSKQGSLDVRRYEVGDPQGEAINGDFGMLVAAAEAIFGRHNGGNKPQGKKPRNVKDMSREDLEDDLGES